MSFEYQSFASLGVNLNRQKYGPLDISNVFTTQADLNYYISKGTVTEGVSDYWKATVPYPYAGQYVALVDNATKAVQPYILVEKENGTFEASQISGTDTNTTYTFAVEDSTDEDGNTGVKLTFKPSDAAATEYFIADPDLSDYLTSADKTALEEEIAKKANAADVYTKTETDTAIATAVSEADHLKRKIVDTKEEIKLDAADAMQYIYMVPTGVESDDNKYHEYIVLEEDGNRYLEEVGNWEVDLSAYAKTSEVDTKLADYAKSADVKATYAKSADLDDYAKTADVAATYATIIDAATKTELSKAKTALEGAIDGKVDKVEGSRLITTAEVGKLENIEANAQVNFINAVDTSEFAVTSDTKSLGLVAVSQNKVSGLTKTTWSENEEGQMVAATETANLADILVAASYDDETKTGNSGLMTALQAKKLEALVIDEDGSVGISGKVNASNVEGLDAFITTSTSVSALNTRVGSLENLINNETAGLAALNTKVGNLESSLDNYVLKTTYDDDIAEIKESIIWGSIVSTEE